MGRRVLSMIVMCAFLLSLFPAAVFAEADFDSLEEPKVVSVELIHQSMGTEQMVQLYPQRDTKPEINLTLDSEAVFRVKFDRMERIDRVYITSTKADGIRYLEAYYDQDSGTYIGGGTFLYEDASYMPGAIGVSYTKKAVPVTQSTAIDTDLDLTEIGQRLDKSGVRVQNIQLDNTGAVSAQVVLDALLEGMSNVYVDAVIDTCTAYDRYDLDQWLGVYQDLENMISYDLEGAQGNPYVMYLEDKDLSGTDSWVVIVHDVTGNRYTKLLLKQTAGAMNLGDISDGLVQANTVSGMLLKYSGISDEMDLLREAVTADVAMSTEEQLQAMERIDSLERDKKTFTLAASVLPMLVGAVVTTGGAALSAAPAVLFSALLGGLTSSSEYFWEHRIGMIRGCDPVDVAFVGSSIHAGGGVPLTRAYLDELRDNGERLKSGSYYLEEDISFITLGRAANQNDPVDITLCLCGHTIDEIHVNVDCSAEIHDCRYWEDQEGAVHGGAVLSSSYNNGKLMLRNVYMDDLYNTGELLIQGGTIERLEVTDGQSGKTTTINSGTVKYLNVRQGNVVINGGTVPGNRVGIWRWDGEYSNYLIKGGIELYQSSLEINGGVIGPQGEELTEVEGYNYRFSDYGVDAAESEVVISGGTIAAIAAENSTVNISGGTIRSLDNDAGEVLMEGTYMRCGPVSNDEAGVMTIRGGVFSDDQTVISNEGLLTVYGGHITGNSAVGLKNSEQGKVYIYGGAFGGTHGIYTWQEGQITFVMGESTTIELWGQAQAVNVGGDAANPSIVAGEEFPGMICFYDEAEGQAQRMTLTGAQAAVLPTSSWQPGILGGNYCRLESAPLEVGLAHATFDRNEQWGTVSLFCPERTAYLIRSAYGTDGRLLKLYKEKVEATERETQFSEAFYFVEADYVIFFLVDELYRPLCESAVAR